MYQVVGMVCQELSAAFFFAAHQALIAAFWRSIPAAVLDLEAKLATSARLAGVCLAIRALDPRIPISVVPIRP